MEDQLLREKISAELIKRAKRLDYEDVYEILDREPFILAGGALCGDPINDFDIYPVHGHPFRIRADIPSADGMRDRFVVLSHTKNALTVRLSKSGQVVQFCNYMKDSLKDLVESFDYSHIQAGCLFPGNCCWPNIDDVYFTDAFIVASVSRLTEYVGSDYPLSSLIRCAKYLNRGRLTRAGAGRVVIKVLTDILERGFVDYEDFKDQLDAIDLGMADIDGARTLYDTVLKVGLMK